MGDAKRLVGLMEFVAMRLAIHAGCDAKVDLEADQKCMTNVHRHQVLEMGIESGGKKDARKETEGSKCSYK